MQSVFILITQDNWDFNMKNLMVLSDNPILAALFTIITMVLGVYTVLNLFLAILLSNLDQVRECVDVPSIQGTHPPPRPPISFFVTHSLHGSLLSTADLISSRRSQSQITTVGDSSVRSIHSEASRRGGSVGKKQNKEWMAEEEENAAADIMSKVTTSHASFWVPKSMQKTLLENALRQQSMTLLSAPQGDPADASPSPSPASSPRGPQKVRDGARKAFTRRGSRVVVYGSG